MLFKNLGDAVVPAIGQGTQGIKNPDIIKLGLQIGMTFIDTAEMYKNEEVIGEAVKTNRNQVFISTKCFPGRNKYDDVIKSCEESLKRLKTDYIDLYSLHWTNPVYPLEDTMNAFIKLKSDGKIRYIGACNLSFAQLKRCSDILSALQVEYNLFDRSIEKDILPYCQEKGIVVVAYSPFNHFYQLNSDSMLWLQEIAYKYQKRLTQISLNWLISHIPVITIPKTHRPDHMIVNAQAADFKLSKEDLNKIDKLFPTEIRYIEPKRIRVSKVGKFPQSIDEALKNITNFTPSPLELSNDIDEIKPIRVEPIKENMFELVEGGCRFWAWVIKHGDEPIPAIVIGEAPETYHPEPEPKCDKHPEARIIEVNKKKYCSDCYNEFFMKNIGVLRE